MQVLVTGGSGFIGRELCKQLFTAGHTAIVLTRRPQAAPPLPGVRWVSQLEPGLAVDAVVNLAGEPLGEKRWNAQRKQEFRRSRLGTTQQLHTWIESLPQRPRVLVSGSAIGYYGPRDDTPLNEQAPAGEDFAATLCRDWETEALKLRALGLRVCTVRIGIVLAADGGALGKMLPPFKLGAGGPMGTGQQWMSWVLRSDLVRLLLWLIETDTASGAYNGTAPQPVTNREFAQVLGAALHRPAVLPTPAFALKLLFGEMAEALLLSGQRVIPAKAEAEGFVFRHPALPGALRELLG